MIKTKDRFPQA